LSGEPKREKVVESTAVECPMCLMSFSVVASMTSNEFTRFAQAGVDRAVPQFFEAERQMRAAATLGLVAALESHMGEHARPPR